MKAAQIMRVAVVGAGPTGLACAYYLALLGHSVTVYDSRPQAGGMLRYALPEYRLPKQVLDKEIELIERLGVKFEFNTVVGESLGLNDLAGKYDAVFLAIGTWKEGWVYLPGTELTGVIPALPFLEGVERDEKLPVGKKVVVIGGGNAAIDSARTARRLGADVTIVYRRERKDMPAIPEEIEAAEHEGLEPLRFHRLDRGAPQHPAPPRLFIVSVQVVFALACIIGGAWGFVQAIKELAAGPGVNGTLLALLIAPIATELPETLNSVLWVRRGKDTLAMGNITGAMVFQSAIPTSIGSVYWLEWGSFQSDYISFTPPAGGRRQPPGGPWRGPRGGGGPVRCRRARAVDAHP